MPEQIRAKKKNLPVTVFAKGQASTRESINDQFFSPL